MKLLQQIEAAFAESDAQSLDKLPEVIERQRNAYYELKQEISRAFHSHGIESYEYRMACKQNRTLFSESFKDDYGWGHDEHIVRAIKSLKKTHHARNDRIVRRMEKYGITKIDESVQTSLGGHLPHGELSRLRYSSHSSTREPSGKLQ